MYIYILTNIVSHNFRGIMAYSGTQISFVISKVLPLELKFFTFHMEAWNFEQEGTKLP